VYIGIVEVGPLGTDERLAKLEAIIAEDKQLERWERKALKIFRFILFMVALAGPLVWAFFEFAGYVIERLSSFRRALGW
jgi:hypothetical protein